jgi:hypothetical protein
MDRVSENNSSAIFLTNPTADREKVVVPRGRLKAEFGIDDRKQEATLLEFSISYTETTHMVGSRLFAPNQIVGMMSVPHLVSFGISHPKFR